jgi:hypothetical protein
MLLHLWSWASFSLQVLNFIKIFYAKKKSIVLAGMIGQQIRAFVLGTSHGQCLLTD